VKNLHNLMFLEFFSVRNKIILNQNVLKFIENIYYLKISKCYVFVEENSFEKMKKLAVL
jgi:hypothetical protein